MKFYPALALMLVLSTSPTQQQAETPVIKTSCAQATGYKNLDELKTDLLTQAKRLAVNELFGELIIGSTAVENFVVTSDQVNASSMGLVRVEGSVDYHNGKNFAEACVTIRAFANPQDREQFKPVKISKRNCVTDSKLTAPEVITFAKEEVIVQALLDFDRKLSGQDRNKLVRLIQRVSYPESGFVEGTNTYCVRMEGYVVPIEIKAILETVPASADSITGDGVPMAQATAQPKPGTCTTWNLSTDFMVWPDQENPNRDSCGNSNVWHFMGGNGYERDPEKYYLLSESLSEDTGTPGLVRWKSPGDAWRGVYFYTATKPRSKALFIHTQNGKLLIIGWRSPISGSVQISGSISDADANCGDGIAWYLQLGNSNLAAGTIDNSGAQQLQLGRGGDRLSSVDVKVGDFVYLLFLPRGGDNCDTTALDLTLTAK